MRTLVLAFLLASLPGAAAGQISGKQVVDEIRIDQKLNDRLPLDLVFRDESGRDVRLGEYFGERPVILALVYYECPMLCTQILNGMTATFKTLSVSIGDEFDVVTISIDPEETFQLAAEKKQAYLGKYGRKASEKGWHFLTGDQASITAIASATGFHYVYDEQTGEFAHASAIMVVTPGGTLAKYFFGIEYPARDITFALMEASRERIGSAVEQLLLLCYKYDPATGRYSVMVTTVLQIGAVVTMLVLGGFMLIMLRRERKSSGQTITQGAGR